jgi:multidrug efflux pump subunit AcrB
MKDLKGNYPGLKTTLYFDQSREIKNASSELQVNGLMGIFLVFLILWVSMGSETPCLHPWAFPLPFC